MAILLTGGTGKTSLRIASLLQDARVPFLLTSRKAKGSAPSGMPATKFDWLDPSTYDNPFQQKFSSGDKIRTIYIIAPQTADPSSVIISFVDHAVKKHDVKRLVMLTGSSSEKGDSYIGRAWKHLEDLGVEYTVLRATWFMENLSEWQYVNSIKDEGKIYTACADGKIPFVSASDIAAVAFHALTDTTPHETDIRVLGPELLTYDDVAVKMGSAIGRKVTHVKISEAEVVERYKKIGMPRQIAAFMGYLESSSARGDEERSNNAVEKATGKLPQKLDDWAAENRAVWQ